MGYKADRRSQEVISSTITLLAGVMEQAAQHSAPHASSGARPVLTGPLRAHMFSVVGSSFTANPMVTSIIPVQFP